MNEIYNPGDLVLIKPKDPMAPVNGRIAVVESVVEEFGFVLVYINKTQIQDYTFEEIEPFDPRKLPITFNE